MTKEKIQEQLFYNHYKDMKEEMENSKKMSKVKHEDFRKEQEYMNDESIDSSRTQLRVRPEMLKTRVTGDAQTI